jgi:hypothetical protein
MGQPVQFSKALIAANATVVAASQARATPGALTLSGTPVVLDSQRRIAIALTASNSGAAIIVTGGGDGAGSYSETIVLGASATSAVSTLDFKTITSIICPALTGNISVGTNTTGSSPWFMANPWTPPPQNIHIATTLASAGTPTYSVEYTLDADPCGIRAPITSGAIAFTAGSWAGVTTSQSALLAAGTAGTPCTAYRLTITAGTGNVIVQAMQAG